MDQQIHLGTETESHELLGGDGEDASRMPTVKGILDTQTSGRTWKRSDSPLLGKKSSLGASSHLENKHSDKQLDRDNEHEHNSQTRQGKLQQQVIGLNPDMVMMFCFLLIMASIAIVAIPRSTQGTDNLVLPNGDHIRRCKDFPSDMTCFEVCDVRGHVIYRNHGQNRTLEFFECSPDAPETKTNRCVGEYAFSHNSSALWNVRLYLDDAHMTYSIISGPAGAAHLDAVPRVRHILSPPYNWIIAFQPIPQNSYPGSLIFVDGEVHVRTVS